MPTFENILLSEDNSNKDVYISFVITGINVNPQQISKMLEIQPIKFFRKGELYQSSTGRTMVKPTGHWSFNTKTLTSTNVEIHAQSLLEKLGSKVYILKTLCTNHQITISIWWETKSFHGGFSLSSATAKKLGEICSRIDFRFIYMGNENEDECDYLLG